jgi:hypothetical protein
MQKHVACEAARQCQTGRNPTDASVQLYYGLSPERLTLCKAVVLQVVVDTQVAHIAELVAQAYLLVQSAVNGNCT